jgi:hypothetical protein
MPDLDLYKHDLPVLEANQVHFKPAMTPITLEELEPQFLKVIPCQILSPSPHLPLRTRSSLHLHGAKNANRSSDIRGASTDARKEFVSAA